MPAHDFSTAKAAEDRPGPGLVLQPTREVLQCGSNFVFDLSNRVIWS
jgi:hypothetical protein